MMGAYVQAAGGVWPSEAWAGLRLPALWGKAPHPIPLGRGVSRPPVIHQPACSRPQKVGGLRKGSPGHVTPFCPCDQGPSSDSLWMPAAPGLGERVSRGQKWGPPPWIS